MTLSCNSSWRAWLHLYTNSITRKVASSWVLVDRDARVRTNAVYLRAIIVKRWLRRWRRAFVEETPSVAAPQSDPHGRTYWSSPSCDAPNHAVAVPLIQVALSKLNEQIPINQSQSLETHNTNSKYPRLQHLKSVQKDKPYLKTKQTIISNVKRKLPFITRTIK